MRHQEMPTYSFVLLTGALILVNTALAYASTRFFSAGIGGVAYLYPAIAFMILFALWFGGYGAIAAYIGTFVGSGLLVSENLAANLPVALLFAIAGLLQVLIPLVAVRSFDVDLDLENRRDISLVILFAVVINNLVGAAWGAWVLGLLEGSAIAGTVFSSWLIGNVIVSLLLVPAGLKIFTPKVRKSRLFVQHYWD